MAGLPHKYVGNIFAFGDRATINAGLTRYLAATGGTVLASELAVVVPVNGKLKNLSWSAAASGLTGAGNKITVFAKSVATPLVTTWNGAVLSGANAITEVQVLAGDTVSVQIQLAAGGTSLSRPRVSIELEVDSTSRWLADDPSDPNSNVYYVGSGNIGVGTDTPGEKLSVDGIIESETGGFKFPDGSIQTTAFDSPGGINALTGAGGTPPDAVYVDASGRVGIGIGSLRMPEEKLTLAPGSNLAIEMPTPPGAAVTPKFGGNLTPDDYFFKVAASDGTGWTDASAEFSIVLSGTNKSCNISWGPVVGATTYKIYRATTAGGPYESRVLTSNSFLYDSDAGFTPDIPPAVTTAYVCKSSASGPSWVLGGSVGVGTTTPQAKLDIRGDLRLQVGTAIKEFSADETLSDNSDSAVPTERAVREYIDDLLAGSVAAFAMEVPPPGWLECNGQALSRSVYVRLFNRIGTTFGKGDAVTTFNVPDLRGQFVRGWNHGSGVDPDSGSRNAVPGGGASGDRVGSVQLDQIARHAHAMGTGGADCFSMAPGGATQRLSHFIADEYNAGYPKATLDSGGNETRPKNTYLNYCIKI